MRIRKYKKKRDFPIVFLKVAFVFSILFLVTNFFYGRIRPIVITAASHQAKIIVTNAINDVVAKELAANRFDYADIITISYDGEGRVTSVETNALVANTFKAKMLSAVLKELKSVENQSLYIPIGSLSDSPFLLGKGPKINFRISSSGIADARFESEFFSAGINQTCHRIKLVISAKISALVPGFITSCEVVGDYYISETIIVGVTPDFFTDIF